MRTWLFAALALLAGCASTQRTLSYQASWPDADVTVGTHRYQVWFHDRDPTILLQRGPPAPLPQTLAQNYTIYAADRSEPEPVWRAAANAVLQPMGCEAREITGADQMREVTYTCATTVDMRMEVAARRGAWQRGVHVDDPMTLQPQPRY